jgi:hypothetical protein
MRNQSLPDASLVSRSFPWIPYSLKSILPHMLMILGMLFIAWPALTWGTSKLVSSINDDSFYYLTVAHNIVLGHGSSFDGINLTNGYHPLWMLLLIPIYYLITNIDLALRITLVFQTILIFASLELLYRELGPIMGRFAFIAVLPMAFYLRFTYLFNSVESPVVILTLAVSLVMFVRVIRYEELEHISSWAVVNLGLSLGLLFAARIDYVFFPVVALFMFVGRAILKKQIGSHTIMKAILLILPTILCAIVWFAWNWVNFGHIMSISGAMKNTFPAFQSRIGYWSFQYPEYFVIALMAVGFIALYFSRQLFPGSLFLKRSLEPYAPILDAVVWLCLGTLLHYGFVSAYGKWAVRFWYFAGYIVTLLVLVALVVAIVRDQLNRQSEMRYLQYLFMSLIFAVGLLVALVSNLWAADQKAQGIIGFQPYAYQAALWVKENLPGDAILGMNDAGTLGYFSERKVVNLDGVINNYEYQDYLRNGRFVQYLNNQKISYLVMNSVSDPKVLDGSYNCINFSSFSYLYDVPGGSIEVCKEQEVYRSKVFLGGGPSQLIVWKISNH